MERCERCDVDEEKVRLFDVVYEGKFCFLCERCTIIENVPIIKKPDEYQLKESEKGVGVYERLKKISGIKDEKESEDIFFADDRLKELERNPRLELPEKKSLDLIEHFHWEIMNNRRRKGLSHKQLSEAINEPDIYLEMLEKGAIPENSERIIRKLEQFFQIRLRKINETEILLKKPEKKPVLLDEYGNELKLIPEPEIHCKVEIKRESETPLLDGMSVVKCKTGRTFEQKPSEDRLELDFENEDFDLNKIDIRKVKIDDLRRIHRKKIEASKQEKIEEQKKIERRQELIEARKEELRLMKEKESMGIDHLLGGRELLEKEKDE